MSFAEQIREMTQAAARGDGAAVAACFTDDGVYHDVFYGAFEKSRIAEMIEGYFHRDAENFRWDIHDPVELDGVGYARYVFSYDSKLPGCEGKRAIFERVSVCRVEKGLLKSYTEVANTAPGLGLIGFAPERLAKVVARQAEELKSRPEAKPHGM